MIWGNYVRAACLRRPRRYQLHCDISSLADSFVLLDLATAICQLCLQIMSNQVPDILAVAAEATKRPCQVLSDSFL